MKRILHLVRFLVSDRSLSHDAGSEAALATRDGSATFEGCEKCVTHSATHSVIVQDNELSEPDRTNAEDTSMARQAKIVSQFVYLLPLMPGDEDNY